MVDSWAEFCFRIRVIAEGDLYRDMISRFYYSPSPFTMLSYLVFLSVCVSSLINGLMVPFEKQKTLSVWLVGLWIRRRHWIEFITKDLFARNQLNDSRQWEWPSKGHAVVTLRSARVVAATSNISLPLPIRQLMQSAKSSRRRWRDGALTRLTSNPHSLLLMFISPLA